MKQYIHGGDVYRHPGVLDFSANLNPLGTPETVIRATQDSILQIAQYPDACQEQLIEELAKYEEVPKEWLICGNGAAELIFALVHAMRPKKALLAVPTFAEYEQALSSCGCEVQYVYLQESRGFIPGDEILDAITEQTDLLFWCNPNNPTGVLTSPNLLKRIMKRCQETDTFLVVDECFLDFVEGGESVSLKATLKENRHVFLLKAFTKRYAMPGIRLGYGITANETLLQAMERQMQPWNVSIPAQAAGIAALKETAYVEQACKLIEREKEFLCKELERLGMKIYGSRANYIFFRGQKDLYEKLLEEKVLIRDCSNYPGLEKGYYRIAVKKHEENCQLLEVMSRVVLMT